MDNTKNLEDLQIIKTAKGGVAGGLLADVASSAGGLGAIALLTLPALAGAGVGYGVQQFKKPSDENFRNLSKEMLLAEINKQKSQLEKMQNMQYGQIGSEDEVESAAKAEREIHA